MKTFARKCSVTGELFNEGYVWYDGAFYTKDEATTAAEIRKDIKTGEIFPGIHADAMRDALELDDSDLIRLVYDETDGAIYFTEWEEDDHQYMMDDHGFIHEIDETFNTKEK